MMHCISDYEGTLLGHVEALYRPGERALATAFAQALGCVISDTGFTGGGPESFLALHPNPDDRDLQTNAIYISPMRPEQLAIEQHLSRLGNSDPELRASLCGYRAVANTAPFGVSHFALRYPSAAAVERVAEDLQRTVGPLLGDRLKVRIFRPEEADSAGGELLQGFVYQDVIVSGSFFFGQLIELQSRNS